MERAEAMKAKFTEALQTERREKRDNFNREAAYRQELQRQILARARTRTVADDTK